MSPFGWGSVEYSTHPGKSWGSLRLWTVEQYPTVTHDFYPDSRIRVWRWRWFERCATSGAVNWCGSHSGDRSPIGRCTGGKKTQRPSQPSPSSRCAPPDGTGRSEATESAPLRRPTVSIQTQLTVGDKPRRASVCCVLHTQVSSWMRSAADFGKTAGYPQHSAR